MIARQIRNSPLWRSMKATHRAVLLEILLQAQWQDTDVIRDGEVIPLKRGQLATSYNQIVEDIGDKEITVKVVRNAIAKMLKADFLTKDEEKARTKKGLLLTVVKWEVFQNPDNYKRLSENEVRIDHHESKVPFLGNDMGKEENPQNLDTAGVLFPEITDGGNVKGKVRAKQGQSEGKARAINNKSNKSNKEKSSTYSAFELEILSFWNSKEIVQHQETEDLQKEIAKALKTPGKEAILSAIDHYVTLLRDEDFYYSHNWTLEKFLKQKNGMPDFLDDGAKWIDYKARLKTKTQSSSGRYVDPSKIV